MKIVCKNYIKYILVIFIALIGLTVLSTPVLSLNLIKNTKQSSQSDYPILEDPIALDMMDFTGTDMLTYMSDVIVEGKVMEVLEPEEVNFKPEPGTPEAEILKKIGKDVYENSINPIRIQVINVLKGEVKEEIILYRSALTVGCEPDLRVGDSMVFFLNNNNKSLNGFSIVHPHSGYFYISSDKKVYPAKLVNNFKKESGKKIKEFKEDIINYAKNQGRK